VRALIVQIEEDDPPGHIGEHLTAQGVEWDVVLVSRPHEPLSLDRYGMLFVLGGSMSANQTDEYPYVAESHEIVAAALERGVPYLGVCLGAQIGARALDAPVTRSADPEIGVTQLVLRPEAVKDPLTHGLPPVLETVEYHYDTFSLPEGAVLLASSESCPHQIVRIADRAYVVQFHPEVRSADFAVWLRSDLEQGGAGVRDEEHAEELARQVRDRDPVIRANATTLLNNFIQLATER